MIEYYIYIYIKIKKDKKLHIPNPNLCFHDTKHKKYTKLNASNNVQYKP